MNTLENLMRIPTKILKYMVYLAAAGILAAAALQGYRAKAADGGIVRPFQSIRSMSMGGVLYTTGMYTENFYGNPARATANPVWKIQLFDLMAESTLETVGHMSNVISGGFSPEQIAGTAGDNIHARVQFAPINVFIPREKWSFGFGIISAYVMDTSLRNAYLPENRVVADTSFNIVVARKFLEEDRLSVGLSFHAAHRLSSAEQTTLIDLVQGNGLDPTQNGGEGMRLDGSLGATYEIPLTLGDWKFRGGAAINNLMGGEYNIALRMTDLTNRPIAQPRTVSFGVAGQLPALWKFEDLLLALEFKDIGNGGGSVFMHTHMGAEVRFSVLKPRIGFNQGYITAGLGLDFKVVSLEFATYGEEMGENVGTRQDRRFAFRLGFNI